MTDKQWYVDVRDNETGEVIGGYFTSTPPEERDQ